MQLCGARRCRSGLCFRVFMAWKQQHEGRVSYATRHRLMVSMLIGSNARVCLACAQAELCVHVCVQVSRWCHAKDTCKTCYGLCRCLVSEAKGAWHVHLEPCLCAEMAGSQEGHLHDPRGRSHGGACKSSRPAAAAANDEASARAILDSASS